MKRLILLFLFISLLAIGVNASGLSVQSSVKDNLIMVGEEAVFDIIIKNEQEFTDTFTFLVTDLNWEWEKQFFTIAAERSETFELKVKAPEGVVKAGMYTLDLKVYSTKDSQIYIHEPLLVTVLDDTSLLKLEKLNYALNGLNPERETNLLKVIIKNQYDHAIEDVEIQIKSDIFEDDSKKVNFKSAELRTEEFYINLNSNAVEGWHDVNVILKKGENVLLDKTERVKVGSHSDVKEDKEISTGFLVKKTYILKKNEGSVLSEENYRLRLSSFERLFSDAEPEPTLVEKSGRDYYYNWNFEIKPGEEYLITVEINYRDPLFLLIALIIIIYLIIYLTESGITIRKKVLTIKSKEGISYMKILIIIKNKGKREIKNLRVVDRLFNVKTVPTDYGTLRPSKVNRKGEDVTIVWNILSLIGKEERILSYRVNVGVKNKIMLPRAMARYKKGKSSHVKKSNSCLVVS